MRRKTQTTEYWQELTIDDSDLAFLDDLFLEKERPLSTDELALACIRHRCEAEEALIRSELAKGTVYQPKETYGVGDRLVFPVLDFALGTVVGTRQGLSPEHGAFTVVRVEFQPDKPPREFASQLTTAHPLNFDEDIDKLLWSEDYLTPEELFELYGPGLRQKLVERLDTFDETVQFGDFWFNRAMMAQVHLGHCNIVEAMIDIHNKALPTQALLKELELPAEIGRPAQTFSINYALSCDERFIDVGSAENVLWHLVRLTPPEVLYPPRRLQYQPLPYMRSLLTEELFRVEREIDDEASELIAPPGVDSVKSVAIILTYPHRRVGTLPLTARTSHFFPLGTSQRTLITLLDAHSGKEMPAWVNHQHRYVYGLEQWYKDNRIPVGAYIHLERTANPFKIKVGYKSRRMRREWVRVAQVTGKELNFAVQKMPISCDYDEYMLVWSEDAAEIDALWVETQEANKSLVDIVKQVFLELAKLNPQGTVHAKTLYSAVNIIRRCPPGPIFAELLSKRAFLTVGDANWRYMS